MKYSYANMMLFGEICSIYPCFRRLLMNTSAQKVTTLKKLISYFFKTDWVGHISSKLKIQSKKRQIAKNQLKSVFCLFP